MRASGNSPRIAAVVHPRSPAERSTARATEIAFLEQPRAATARAFTEHDRAGEVLARLRALTAGYATPVDGCASYHALYEGLQELETDTHLHIHKENNVLFPAVVALEQKLESPGGAS